MHKHYKIKIMILGGFLISVLSLQAWGQISLAPLVKKIQPAVATITTFDSLGNSLKLGSGFFVSKKGVFLTNHHVVEGASRIMVEIPAGGKYEAKQILVEDGQADIVVLLIDIPSDMVNYLKVSGAIPEIGDRVMVIGSPMGLEQTISDGVVSAVRSMAGIGEILQISAPISPGSSGGPVVNMKGSVIGVATFQIKGGQNLNFAIPGYRLLSLMAKAGNELNASRKYSEPEADDKLDKAKEQNLQYTDQLAKRYHMRGSAALLQATFYHGNKQYWLAEDKYKEAIRCFETVLLFYPYSTARVDLMKANSSLDLMRSLRQSSPDTWKNEYKNLIKP